ncbi:MAG: chorismate mutase [Rhodospirillales bacterium]
MTREPSLETVRKEIDAIDAAMHELIIRRTELVEKVRRIKRDWQVKIQPSREAEIVYGLLARHSGPFPKRELISIWRLLITATLSFEGRFSVAVLATDGAPGTWDVARDHFGAFTPVSRHGSVRAVIDAVRRQEATVGVLPLPSQDDADPWWRHLLTTHADAPKIIARLPFAGPSNAREGGVDALVVCPVAVKATGRDRTLLGADSDGELTAGQFAQALRQAGLTPGFLASRRETEPPHAFVFYAEVAGFVGADDPRLEVVRERCGAALHRLIWLGGYAEPPTAAELGAGWSAPALPAARPPARPEARGETGPASSDADGERGSAAG